ncbi:MAG TPA: hypothetical protein VHE55_08090 [Fimbriimonadaceae bacterium]|nr:hypothetical protein [Fimbriimonadaceae bacterium]
MELTWPGRLGNLASGDEIDKGCLIAAGIAAGGPDGGRHPIWGPTVTANGQRYILYAPAIGDVAARLLQTRWSIHARCFDRFEAEQPPLMEQGQCYRNARILAQRRPGELHFFEGVYGKFLRETPNVIAVCAHAWCLNRDGQIIEPTVPVGEARFYYGVPVPHRELDAIEETPFRVDAKLLQSRWQAFGRWLRSPRDIAA